MDNMFFSVDGASISTFGALSLWLFAAMLYAWWHRARSDEINMLVGWMLLTGLLTLNLLWNNIRRWLRYAGEQPWWFFDHWSYLILNGLGFLVTALLIVRAFTVSRHGEWPWIVLLVFISVSFLFPQPSIWLAHAAYDTINWLAGVPAPDLPAIPAVR